MDVCIVAGGPGCGKSTLAARLRVALRTQGGLTVPEIDVVKLRQFHLDADWQEAGPAERAMNAEAAARVVENYLEHDRAPVLIHDLRPDGVWWMADRLAAHEVLVVTLHVPEPVLAARVGARTGGFRDVEHALALQRETLARGVDERELRLDATLPVEQLVTAVLAVPQGR